MTMQTSQQRHQNQILLVLSNVLLIKGKINFKYWTCFITFLLNQRISLSWKSLKYWHYIIKHITWDNKADRTAPVEISVFGREETPKIRQNSGLFSDISSFCCFLLQSLLFVLSSISLFHLCFPAHNKQDRLSKDNKLGNGIHALEIV